MDRRGFLQVTGLGAVGVVAGSSAVVTRAAESHAAGVKKLPARAEVKVEDTWDLSSLFSSDEAWEKAFEAWQKQIKGYAAFTGKLAESAEKLGECIAFDLDVERQGDRLGTYAALKVSEDQSNSTYQRMQGAFRPGGESCLASGQLHPPGNFGDS